MEQGVGSGSENTGLSIKTHSKKISWVELSGLNRVTESAHKELIVAHVERRNGHADEEQLR